MSADLKGAVLRKLGDEPRWAGLRFRRELPLWLTEISAVPAYNPKSVAYVNNGKFRVKTEAEQNIWNECSRLIANAIIYYNTALLSKVYEQKRASGDEEAIAALRGVSPVAWRHVNLIGRFEFTSEAPQLDIDALAARYAEPGYWDQVFEEGEDGSLA